MTRRPLRQFLRWLCSVLREGAISDRMCVEIATEIDGQLRQIDAEERQELLDIEAAEYLVVDP